MSRETTLGEYIARRNQEDFGEFGYYDGTIDSRKYRLNLDDGSSVLVEVTEDYSECYGNGCVYRQSCVVLESSKDIHALLDRKIVGEKKVS